MITVWYEQVQETDKHYYNTSWAIKRRLVRLPKLYFVKKYFPLRIEALTEAAMESNIATRDENNGF